jgi:predicted nucleic acid-binding Zn ribbon protein
MAGELISTPITYIKSLHKTSDFPYILCKYCAEPITEAEAIDYFGHAFCSNDCVELWKGRKNLFVEEYRTCAHRTCAHCGKKIKPDDSIKVYRAAYCSVDCVKKQNELKLLKRCQKGEISFLDLPTELRNKDRKIKSYKCKSNICKLCGNVFYTSETLGETQRKYCSDRCRKVAMKPVYEMTGLRNTGWLSPNWRGGINNGEYCNKFNADLRRRVRLFFKNKCFLCGKPQEENGKRLSVHHVNYNKNACCDSSKVMMVPLCQTCHGITNSNREYWEDYFEGILRDKYDYKCYYSKEEYNNLGSQESSS